MLTHTCLGTNDLPRAAAYYDALLPLLGAKRMFEGERSVGWGTGQRPMFSVMKPFDGKPATVGNGSMLSFAAPDIATVQAVHAKALELGSQDEGAPGPRGMQYYGAYWRDLDGNKLAVFTQV